MGTGVTMVRRTITMDDTTGGRVTVMTAAVTGTPILDKTIGDKRTTMEGAVKTIDPGMIEAKVDMAKVRDETTKINIIAAGRNERTEIAATDRSEGAETAAATIILNQRRRNRNQRCGPAETRLTPRLRQVMSRRRRTTQRTRCSTMLQLTQPNKMPHPVAAATSDTWKARLTGSSTRTSRCRQLEIGLCRHSCANSADREQTSIGGCKRATVSS
jgi:hypothetical protein